MRKYGEHIGQSLNFAPYVLCIYSYFETRMWHSEPGVTVVKNMKQQTDPYGKAMKKWTKK